MLCPHCNVEPISTGERILANPIRPAICPRCGAKSSPHLVWALWTASTLIAGAIVAFITFSPTDVYILGMAALFLLLCASFVTAALLPLAPVTEADELAAKRAHRVSLFAMGLLVVALFIHLIIRTHAAA